MSNEHRYEFFQVIQGYLKRAARVINMDPTVEQILSQPKNEIIVHFPVRMDNGDVKVFKGYRIQHNNLLGPYKGGIRYHESVTLDDVKALAAMMTWKCALMRLPFGVWQGWNQVQPARAFRRRSCSESRGASPRAPGPTSDRSTTSRRPTWGRTAR